VHWWRALPTCRLICNKGLDAGALTPVSGRPSFLHFDCHDQQISGSSNALLIGALNNAGSYTRYLNGYIDHLRITKGAGRYSANFTPTASELPFYYAQIRGTVKDADGNFVRRVVRAHRRDTGALVDEVLSDPSTGAFTLNCDDASKHYAVVHDADAVNCYFAFDGTNGSQTIQELSGKVVTVNGNAQISTAQSKFGGASAYFSGVSDYLLLADSPDFHFTRAWSIEFWMYPTAKKLSWIFQQSYGTGDSSPVRIDWRVDGTVLVYGSSDNLTWLFLDGLVTNVLGLNMWHHIALTSDGTIVRLFADGMLAAFREEWPRVDSIHPLRIGGGYISGDRTFPGYIDDLRISKGVARYTANFTPPASPQMPAGSKNALVYDLLTPV